MHRDRQRHLRSLGVIDRVPTGVEEAEAERRAGGRALWRLECAQYLTGAVEIQVLMAAGAAAYAGHGDISITLTGREFYGGAGADDDAARIGVLLALTRRLADQVMLLTARLRRGDADDGLPPLVMRRSSWPKGSRHCSRSQQMRPRTPTLTPESAFPR